MILKSCVPELSQKQASMIVNEAQQNSQAAILLQGKTSADKGCKCLIENGLFASIEDI